METDVRLTPAYFTGDFGSGVDTDIAYVPLTLIARSARNEFRGTLPFISIRTDEPVTFVGGDIIPRGTGGPSTESGLGDVVLRDDYFFLQGDARRPWASIGVRVKLPTADESRGLGSGELDLGPGVGIIQPLGSRWHGIAEALYVLRGDPPGIDYRNTLWVLIGAQVRLSEASRIQAFFERRDSVIDGRETIRDLSLGYSRRLSPAVTFRSTLFLGLSDTAEEFGLSAGLSFRGAPAN